MANLILNRPKKHLLIPDSHAHPDYGNERYDYLAKLIIDVKPDVVIDIGDWFDMASLCSYDRGKKGFEARSYRKDIEVGIEAQDRMLMPVKRRKKKMPRLVRTLGNHEHRINRVLETETILDGTISMADLQSKEYGFEEYNFGRAANVDGINYSHYFTSGVMGRPAASARSLLSRQRVSCSMGHSHLFDYELQNNVEGKTSQALICGCFVDYDPSYAHNTSHLWWRGVHIKHEVQDGSYDLESISMERLKSVYGS